MCLHGECLGFCGNLTNISPVRSTLFPFSISTRLIVPFASWICHLCFLDPSMFSVIYYVAHFLAVQPFLLPVVDSDPLKAESTFLSLCHFSASPPFCFGLFSPLKDPLIVWLLSQCLLHSSCLVAALGF